MSKKNTVVHARVDAKKLADLILLMESRGEEITSISAAIDKIIFLTHKIFKEKMPRELTLPEAIGVLSKYKVQFSKNNLLTELAKEVEQDELEQDESIEERAKRLSQM